MLHPALIMASGRPSSTSYTCYYLQALWIIYSYMQKCPYPPATRLTLWFRIHWYFPSCVYSIYSSNVCLRVCCLCVFQNTCFMGSLVDVPSNAHLSELMWPMKLAAISHLDRQATLNYLPHSTLNNRTVSFLLLPVCFSLPVTHTHTV